MGGVNGAQNPAADEKMAIKMLTKVQGKFVRLENGKFFEKYYLSAARKQAMY